MNKVKICAVAMAAGVAGTLIARESVSLDGRWEFRRDSGARFYKVQFSPWEKVTVPHDWAIAGPYFPNQPGGDGKLPWKAKGEYRRKFTVTNPADRHYLEFDGVMARPQVFVNGVKVGGWDYGYMSFRVEATEAVKPGENELKVSVDTTTMASRWYPGAGIYRSVRLISAKPGEAVPGTVEVTPSLVSPELAKVRVRCEKAGGGVFTDEFEVEKPRLWSVEDPYLHETEVCGEKVRYGIRKAEFTADDGFHLNGRRVQLKGVDLHSDMGPLGMAFDRDAMKRQLLLMKSMGVNALRTSHNPPAPQVLELCDEMGIVVWDECFDKWNGSSGVRPFDNIDEYLERNLAAFIRRDRNHPSVVIWSIGNEMRFEGEPPDGNVTPERVKRLAEKVRLLDPTRPVAAGCDLTEMLDSGCWDSLDVTGWNYGRRYREMKKRKPGMPLVYSESASAYSDYGFYALPPAAYRDDYSLADRKTDSYDHTSAPWSDIPDIEFYRMETDRYVAGEFVWTGIDYLGEPCPYSGRKDIEESEQARSSYFGICDLCGIPKDRYYLYRSHWLPEETTCHLVPAHWNFEAKTTLPVYVYTSGDEAELFLNGRSLGRRVKKDPPADYDLDFEGMEVKKYPDFRSNPYYRVCDKYRLRWFDVPYEPGELKAVCYRKGVKIGEDVVRTAGEPVAIRLKRNEFSCGNLDWIEADLVDQAGARCPSATDRVTFAVEGPGVVAATGSGDPRDYEPFPIPSRRLYFGKACAVVRRTGAGEIRLRAYVDGLPSASLSLR